MTLVRHHDVSGPLSESRAVAAPRWLFADGLIAGALVGLVATAALEWAPRPLVEVAGFLAAPALAALGAAGSLSPLAAAAILIGGSMLLYAGYAVALLGRRAEGLRIAAIVAIVLLHAVCFVAWTAARISAIAMLF